MRRCGVFVFEAECAALPHPQPLCSSYIPLSLAPGLLTSLPSSGTGAQNLELVLGLCPGLRLRAQALVLAQTLAHARAFRFLAPARARALALA